ncbi:LysR family transcriptional regulator [Clostridium sp. PL3]|uniref:LysR family transcriptional regulator n=1 Tax=Clostridium thailandense TaxID=2794346 RepID=A0A949TYP8_9CLOT|nr:LysR family transcriptional regulator [Clostridium thailandense]MBV7272969.1 LysR family transcriptional regulator [Clostridium thailandense]
MNMLLSNINIQQIVIFLAVAEQGGFAKAALTLHMTQSAISKSIAKLESELNLMLFIRTTKKLSLTNVGDFLYKRWKVELSQMQNTYREALEIHMQEEKSINICIANTTHPDKYFWPVIELFQQKYSDVKLNIDSDYLTTLYEKLTDGIYDIIFVPDFNYYSFDDKIVSWKWVAINNIQIIVPDKNPLSQKSLLTIDDIKNESFIIIEDDDTSKNYSKFFYDFFKKTNIKPRIGKSYKNAYSAKAAYKMIQDLMLTDDYFDLGQYENLKRIPLQGYYNGIVCVWNKKIRTPYIQKLIDFFPNYDINSFKGLSHLR